jgi:glycosyltransferase 2 family protein
MLLSGCVATSVGGCWFAWRGLNVSELQGRLDNANLPTLILSVAVFGLAIAVRGLRWWVLFRPDERPSKRDVNRAMLVGYLFNNILPARAGEAARVIALRRTAVQSYAEIAGTVISERLIDTLALVGLFLAATPWLPAAVVSPLALVGLCVAVGAAGLAVAAIAWLSAKKPEVLRAAGHILRVPARAHAELAQVRDGLTIVVSSPTVARSCVGLTVASWLLMGISNWILLRSLGLPVGLEGGVLIALATGIAMIIPSAPASIGVFEATTVLVLGGYPVSHTAAVSYAVALHALTVLPLILVGIWATITVPRRADTQGSTMAAETLQAGQVQPPPEVRVSRVTAGAKHPQRPLKR